MTTDHDGTDAGGVSRRGLLALASGGLGAILLSSLATPAYAAGATATAVASTPSPKLPGEYWRSEGLVSRYGGTVFDNICVRINGDSARLYIPRNAKPGGAPTTVVWLFHGAGSDHNALDGGFKTTGERIVDKGAIAICQNAGGTLFSHPTACALQVAGYQYLSGIYNIHTNVLRATSAGGALAVETYASGLIPKISGIYNVNATYDIEAMYAAGGRQQAGVTAAFGDNPAAIAAANPARHGSSAWSGDRIRVVVSQPESSDTSVPPSQHGLALVATASSTAAEASVRTHTTGHNTPAFADTDFMDAYDRWVPPIVVDTTPPTVAITSPAMGATVKGVTTLKATASDNIGLASVAFTVDGASVGNATLSAGVWILALDSAKLSNARHIIRAVATDLAGNATTSAWVAVNTSNTAPPTVALVAPASGATVSGTVAISATASSTLGIAGVTFMAGTRTLGPGTLKNGVWTLSFNTKSAASPNGIYSLTAVAKDTAGAQTVSAPRSVTIKN